MRDMGRRRFPIWAAFWGIVGAIGTVGAQEAPIFVRGDVNQDRIVDTSDAIGVLLHLFRPGFVAPCEKAADVNDSGSVDLTDAIYALSFLFKGGARPPAPFAGCGTDPTPDALGCASTACGAVESTVVLSEILASNSEGLEDEDGDASDWIEIYVPENAASGAVDLGGWYLTGDPDLVKLWRIPDGVTVDRGAFLVIFASGKDRAVAGDELHTDFELDRDGEYLALVAPDGVTVVDEFAPAFPEQLIDVSYGSAQSTTVLVAPGATARYHVPSSADEAIESSWTSNGFDDGAWSTGPSGLGFSGVATEGFEVTYIKASVQVDSLTAAENVLDNPAQQSRVVRDKADVIDYFNTGERGNFRADQAFPGISFGDVDDFVVLVEGTILIPAAGAWSFGVNSDDGFGLELSDGNQTFRMSHPTPRGPADTIQVFNIPRAGPWDLSLVFYERGGGAELELFAAQGNHPSFNSRDFALVGDVAGGGLALLGFAEDIATDLGGAMQGTNASLWARFDFDVADPDSFGGLVLSMKYEDGFVAFLNGEEVARRNAPTSLAWNARSSTNRPIESAALAEEINLTEHLGLLRTGENVLAIWGLNDSVANSDFLVLPELVAAGRFAERQYMTTPTPGAFNQPGSVDFVRDVEFSEEHGFFQGSFSLELSTPTPNTEIRYTLDGSTPSSTHGTVYSSPITISRTSIVRAAAFRAGYLDSETTTQSYIFPSDVIRQSPQGQAPGPGWPAGSVNGQILDYGMDPDVVNNASWSGQIVDALLSIPTISLATDLSNLFSSSSGIYVNAGNDGRAWERPVSVELIDPEGTPGFSVNAGLRIRGAFSRSGGNPKHSFRLFFRKEYGPGHLEYPLFGGEGVDEFDKVDLRTSQNYSWAFEGSEKNTFIRDVFSRDVERDMGQPYTRSRYYHLYVDGQYWGLYQTEERVDADYAESYFGGKKSAYDVIKNDSSGSRALQAADGDMLAYRRLYDAATAGFASDTAYYRVLGLRSDGTPNPSGEKLVDAENLMDYMICTYYTGDPDAPVSAWAHFSNNVFAVYNRERKDGFKWFRHDAEHSLGANGGLFEARLLTDPTDRSIGQLWQHFNPAWLHLRLTAHPEYLMQFADRVNRYFSNGGILSSAPNIARWRERANQIDLAVIAASARWGDSKRHPPRTKNDWLQESNWMTGTFFPRRTQIVIDQMRSVNMFPDAAIVSFSRAGGPVDPGFQLSMTQGNGNSGTIWFTTDGTDPRVRGGGIHANATTYTSPIAISETTTVKARVRSGTEWGALTEARFTVGLDKLFVNEFMAANATGLEDADEPGEFPDWIEIYNGSASAVPLEGKFLTDDLLDLTKWKVPAGVSVPAGGFIVFLADDDGTQGPQHTNFKLSQSGDAIAIVDTDGVTILDSIVFDQQIEDVSYGRFPDGSSEWGFHESPTPGAPNAPNVH